MYDTRKNNVSYGNYSQTQKDIIANHKLIISDQWYDSVYVFKAQQQDSAKIISFSLMVLGVLSVIMMF